MKATLDQFYKLNTKRIDLQKQIAYTKYDIEMQKLRIEKLNALKKELESLELHMKNLTFN